MPFKSLLGNCESVSLSPDARLVAYAVRSSDRDAPVTHSGFLASGVPGHAGGAEIELTSIPGGQARILTPGWGSSWCPSWSPDGKQLAFYSDRDGQPQIWMWDRERDTLRVVCQEPVCVFMGFEGVHWTPDARLLVAKLRAPNWNPPPNTPDDAPSLVRDVWTSPAEDRGRSTPDKGWQTYDGSRGDIAVVEVRTGRTRRLGTQLHPFGISLSPDGRYIAAMCFADFLKPPDGNLARYDLHLFAVDGSSHHVLAAGVPTRLGTTFSWSSRSDEIAYTSIGGGAGELAVVSTEGRQVTKAGGEDMCLGDRYGYPPLWSPDGSTIYCATSGRVYAVSRATGEIQNLTEGLGKLALGVVHSVGSGTVREFDSLGSIVFPTRDRDTVRDGLYRVVEGKPSVVVPESNRSLMNLALYGDSRGDWIVGPIEDAANPPDLFAINGTTGEERRLTRLNPHIDIVEHSSRSLISYKGPKGESLRASLLLPPAHKPGTRHPTILHLYYGLRNSGYTNLYDPFFGRLAGTGYALLVPDMPWSDEGPAERIAALALAAADAVVDQGYADPLRMGVMGGSLGGYTVCCVVTRTDRFRAAVAESSFCDLVSFVLYAKGNTLLGVPWVEGGILRLGTTLWEDPQRYIENSPVFRLHHVRTPLLLLHGTADDACPIHQAEEMYAGLLRLGKVATLVRYHGAGHNIGESSTENYKDFQNRVLEWFNRYLRGELEGKVKPIAEQPDRTRLR